MKRRFNEWVKRQERGGRTFNDEQMEWLLMIRDHIATSLVMEAEAFELAPFYEKGGAFKVYQLFGAELTTILDELNEALAA